MNPRRRAAVAILILLALGGFFVFAGTASAVVEVEDAPLFLPMIAGGGGEPEIKPIIPKTTKVLPKRTTTHLKSVSSGGSVFTFAQMTEDLADLEVGDVMVGDVCAAAPYGFLRRVVKMDDAGGELVVKTDAATLEDAITRGSFHIQQTLTEVKTVR